MKTNRYPANLNVKIDAHTREVIDDIALQNRMSIGEATRELLELGIKAQSGSEGC